MLRQDYQKTKKVYEGERRGWKGFKRLLMKAQPEDKDALRVILELYRGLIVKESSIEGTFDEDLMQNLYDTLLACIRHFHI